MKNFKFFKKSKKISTNPHVNLTRNNNTQVISFPEFFNLPVLVGTGSQMAMNRDYTGLIFWDDLIFTHNIYLSDTSLNILSTLLYRNTKIVFDYESKNSNGDIVCQWKINGFLKDITFGDRIEIRFGIDDARCVV